MQHKFLPHLYEAVAQEAMFGIVVFDEMGLCLYINRMGIQLLGSDNPELAHLIPAEEKPNLKNFSSDFLKHDGLYQDILVRNAGGNSFIANIGVRFLEVFGSKAHLLMLQDVTLQKKLQREIMAKQAEIKAAFEELLRQNRQLRDLDLAKDRFVALTTHELRTPLSAMIASAEILKLGLYDNPEQMKEFVDMIYEQGQHLQDLVNDILDFAKIQAGKMEYFLELRDAVPLARSVLRQFEGMADAYTVELRFEDPKTPMLCYFDEIRLKQILSNIVNNAIKYNKAGGKATVSFVQESEVIRILVTDTGNGIAPEQFSKVFNEFETIGTVAEHHKGTGLGMPISRKLAEGMGGALRLASEVGSGSTFWVEIPRTKVLDNSHYRGRPDSGGGDLAA